MPYDLCWSALVQVMGLMSGGLTVVDHTAVTTVVECKEDGGPILGLAWMRPVRGWGGSTLRPLHPAPVCACVCACLCVCCVSAFELLRVVRA